LPSIITIAPPATLTLLLCPQSIPSPPPPPPFHPYRSVVWDLDEDLNGSMDSSSSNNSSSSGGGGGSHGKKRSLSIEFDPLSLKEPEGMHSCEYYYYYYYYYYYCCCCCYYYYYYCYYYYYYCYYCYYYYYYCCDE